MNQLWLQGKVNKVGTNESLADALTKAVSLEDLSYHVENSSEETR